MKPLASSALHAPAAASTGAPPTGASPTGAPKVSVVIPTYNRAHLLGRAIDSIRAQTLTDWELIVVDDGSTDETQALMRHYCAKDSRIHYVRQPHFGAPARGLNLGLRLARGAYLHKQDDDDAVGSRKLEKCAAGLDKKPERHAIRVRWRIYRSTMAQDQYLSEIRYAHPLFFRTASLRRFGGWNEFYKLLEDLMLIWKIYLSDGPPVMLRHALYYYFKSKDSGADIHRKLNSDGYFYVAIGNAMRLLYRWGLPDMVQPHWDLRRTLKQVYFVHRHAFLPSACYAHWQKGTRIALHRFGKERKKLEKWLQTAAPSRFSWVLLWDAEMRLWRRARRKCVPLRWRRRHGWSLARNYFAARKDAPAQRHKNCQEIAGQLQTSCKKLMLSR